MANLILIVTIEQSEGSFMIPHMTVQPGIGNQYLISLGIDMPII